MSLESMSMIQQVLGAPKLPSSYETLTKQHRDAIIRIHALETENQNLMNLLKQALSDNALLFGHRGANPSELLSRIQALEGRNGQSARHQEDVPAPSSSGNAVSTTSVSGHETEQLRAQKSNTCQPVSKNGRRASSDEIRAGPTTPPKGLR